MIRMNEQSEQKFHVYSNRSNAIRAARNAANRTGSPMRVLETTKGWIFVPVSLLKRNGIGAVASSIVKK